MLLVGLTGGIASGKSTVSAFLRALGAVVIDADKLAREVVAKGSEGLDLIAQTFGRTLLAPDGTLDRKKLGDLVFADADKRKQLEAITHPRIFQRFAELSQEAESKGEPAVVYDAPLLIERDLHKGMNATVVVWVPRDLQLQRLMMRDDISLAQAEQRLAAQMPLDEKKPIAQYVIDNSRSLAETEAQTAYVWREVLRRSAK